MECVAAPNATASNLVPVAEFWQESDVVQKLADWDRAKELYPSVKNGVEEWMDFFDRRPDVLHSILGDIYVVTKYDDRKRETGKRLDGRRTMPKDANLDELWDMITPQVSMEPFPAAFKALQGDRSLRAMAIRVGMDHRELSRLLNGKQDLHIAVLEQIASKCRVSPAYFVEWRIKYSLAVLDQIMRKHPNLSVSLAKRLSGKRPEA